MKVRVVYRNDSGISVIHPAPKSKRINETEEQWLVRTFDETIQKSENALNEWLAKPLPVKPEKLRKHNLLIDALRNNLLKDCEHKDIDKTQLPSRRFRNCWRKDDIKIIKIDMVNARKQVLTELRRVRGEELTRTDGLMARASEVGTPTEVDALKTERQKLRDLPRNLTTKLNAIADDTELEKQYPEVLTIEEYKIKADA